MKQDGERCKYRAKVNVDGKHYCRRHAPTNNETTAHVLEETTSTEVITPPTTPNPHVHTGDTNQVGKRVFDLCVLLVMNIAHRFMYLFALLALAFIVHSYAKAYYYNNCDSNLLKSWLFKQSSTCMFISGVIQSFEAWSFDGMTMLTRYAMTTVSEINWTV